MKLWDLVPKGTDPPRVVNVVVETPLGSHIKYAAGKEHHAMEVTKLLGPGFAYPANSGFFARCRGLDGDPLDAMVLGRDPIAPGCVAAVRPIAVLGMTDRGERDDKVICVLKDDPEWERVTDLKGIPAGVRRSLDAFHAGYRKTEQTQHTVRVGSWQGAAAARRMITAGHKRFAEDGDDP